VSADLILTNGRIYTLNWDDPDRSAGRPAANAPHDLDGWHPDAQALAIGDGLILATGTKDEINHYRGPATRVIDLKGAVALPGLIDSHVHIAELGELLQRVNLTGVASPQEAIERIKASATHLQPGEWILGQGWDEGAWANHYPNRQQLDAAFPGHPVLLKSLHGFAVWTNSLALQRAAIDRTTPAPVGGRILVDAAGDPTGILLNRATTLMSDAVPDPSPEQFDTFLQEGLEQMARDGYVAIHQAGADHRHISGFERLYTNHQLPIRVYAMLSARDEPLSRSWIERGPRIDPTGWLDVRAVKAYYDGALGSRGARLLEDYSDRPGTQGVSGEGYGFDAERVADLMRAGFQVGVHAIGDAGNRETLDFFERIYKNVPTARNQRNRIEHAQVISPPDFRRFRDLAIIASMQPPHAVEDKTWAEERLGADRIRGAYAWRSLRRAGVSLIFNSDLPGSDHAIFYGLHAAITRQDKNQQPAGGWYPEQRLSPEEALRAYTSWAAYAAFRENQTGRLAPGRWADITVMDIDPLRVGESNPAQLLEGNILMTLVAGKVVYGADN